ncbi:nitroreductase [Sphingomonas kyeonggiensis]|uniref:Nitroreductase n=1 Tax=Sphingomonas kyeonggiensis TaxID=1268553 RepID=A0A7W7JX27_9SPHN|nr:hypothetical protein [Sphingomonas kyeonggiensis]MBB4836951.1 nitroreductase [Sphingomonas kyeonggiensis]
MAENLDLSTGEEHRISVGVSGWSQAHKDSFAHGARQLDGVTAVRSAGGSTSFYVYYDPASTTGTVIRPRLQELAHSVGAVSAKADEKPDTVPSDAAPTNGTPPTASGDHIPLPEPEPAAPPAIDSSAWTGITSLQERVVAFKNLAPVALAAVDSLITELEEPGSNGGPPLDERKEALDALKALHEALGALLAAAERPGFQWVDGEGLVASTMHFALRAGEKLKDDPMPFAVSALLVALFSVFGAAGIGGWLGSATLRMQKKS